MKASLIYHIQSIFNQWMHRTNQPVTKFSFLAMLLMPITQLSFCGDVKCPALSLFPSLNIPLSWCTSERGHTLRRFIFWLREITSSLSSQFTMNKTLPLKAVSSNLGPCGWNWWETGRPISRSVKAAPKLNLNSLLKRTQKRLENYPLLNFGVITNIKQDRRHWPISKCEEFCLKMHA